MIRKMGQFKVHQRTSDAMFNATCLAKQWNESTGQRKDSGDFMRLKSTKEFINALESEESVTGFTVTIVQRGKNAGTWMHPLLFIDFAMWLNPTFKVKVLQFVHDQLIEFRHLAGDNYSKLTKAMKDHFKEAKMHHFINISKQMNKRVFGKHDKELRQLANKEQLNHMQKLEDDMVMLIERGFVKDYYELKKQILR